jgi:hypothetical protein
MVAASAAAVGTATSPEGHTSLPGGRVVHPASPDHRRDDLHVAQLVGRARDRVAVENDEIGEPPRDEGAPAPLVTREERGADGRRGERLLDGERLLGPPGLAPVERPQDPGADARERVELLDGRVGAVARRCRGPTERG